MVDEAVVEGNSVYSHVYELINVLELMKLLMWTLLINQGVAIATDNSTLPILNARGTVKLTYQYIMQYKQCSYSVYYS